MISILALLIALLLPGIKKARALARTTQCQSNVRQVAMAFHGYAADNKSYLPIGNPHNWVNPLSHGMYWTDMLVTGPDPQHGGYLPEPKSWHWRNYGAYASGVLRCPEVTDEVLRRGGAGYGGYGVNTSHVMRQNFRDGEPTPTHTLLYKIQRQSEIWLVGDAQPTTRNLQPGHTYYGSGANTITCPVGWYWLGLSTTEAGGRHNGGEFTDYHSDVNGGFVDGHVETLSYDACLANERNMWAHSRQAPHHGPYE